MPVYKADGGELVSFADEPPSPSPLLVGAAIGPDPLLNTTYVTEFGVYVSAHNGQPDIYRGYDGGWSDTWAAAGNISGADRGDWTNRSSWHSFKIPPNDVNAGLYDQRIVDFVNSIPVTGRKRLLTYWHEPENNIEAGQFTAAAFKSAANRVGQRIREAAHPDVLYGPVFMGWTVTPASGRNLDDFWMGDGSIDYVGWDEYMWDSMHHDGRAWRTVDDLLDPLVTATRDRTDLPMAIGETGCVADFDDPGRRPTFVRGIIDRAVAEGMLAVCYWDDGVSSGNGRADWYLRHVVHRTDYPGDFPLTSVEDDDAMIAEWNAITSEFRQGVA